MRLENGWEVVEQLEKTGSQTGAPGIRENHLTYPQGTRMYGHKRVRERRDDALSRVSWEQLEVLLATWYRGQGYEVEHTGTGASKSKYDGGIDLKLRRPGDYVLVQVKHWNAYKVPHNDVHQLLGLMVNEGATGAILITSGEFTKAAIEAATRHGHVRLIDGGELREMVGPLPEHAAQPLLLRRRKEVDPTVILIRGAFALIAMFFVLSAVNRALHLVTASLQRSTKVPVSTQISAPSTVPVSRSAPRVPQSPPCQKMIDEPSGIGVDNCTPVFVRKKPTAAEIRESNRKADEAMKTLAPNTPEM